MSFKTPLHRRMRQAAHNCQRYRADPAYRLHKVNSRRARSGKPLYSSIDEIGTDLIRTARARCDRGRFL